MRGMWDLGLHDMREFTVILPHKKERKPTVKAFLAKFQCFVLLALWIINSQ